MALRPTRLARMSEDGDGSEGAPEALPAGCASPAGCEVEYELKFETGMYKVREDEYVIDVQVGGGGRWLAAVVGRGGRGLPTGLRRVPASLRSRVLGCRALLGQGGDPCAAADRPSPAPARRLPSSSPQRLQGELFIFMDVCGRVLGEIRA